MFASPARRRLPIHFVIHILGDARVARQRAFLGKAHALRRFFPGLGIDLLVFLFAQNPFADQARLPKADRIMVLLVAFDLLFAPVNLVLGVLGAGIFLLGEAARVGIHRRRIPGRLRQGADLRGQIRRDAVVVVALGMIAAAAVGLLSSGAMVSVLLPLGLLTVPVLILFVALSLRRAGQQ